ncbi:MAG: methionyl-tRNA formyltransferase [Chloroflexota bacterium]
MSGGAARAAARRARVVFIGTGPFAVEPLRRLAASPGVRIVGVVTAPPRPAGRGRRMTRSPVQEAAEPLRLRPVLTPERLRTAASLRSVLALAPDLVVLADYGQLVPAPLLDVPHGALNLHPSLLPRHRGASPIPATIVAGARETGVTLMRMDAGLDSGPLLAVERVPLAGDETTPELEERLAMAAADLLARSLGPWLRGELMARPQPRAGVTTTRPLRREDGRLDPAIPAAELERQVRAYQPWPGSWLETPVGRIVVWRAEAAGGEGTPGSLVADDDGLALVTANGRLRLLEVQPAGKNRMTGAAFRRGRPAVAGSKVVPPKVT